MRKQSRLFTHFLLLSLLTLPGGALAGSPPGGNEELELSEPFHHWLFDRGQVTSVWNPLTDRLTDFSLQQDFDVLHYRLDLNISPALHTIEGQATLTVRSRVDGLSSIALDMRDELIATAVEDHGTPLAFTHHGHVLRVTLGTIAAGAEFTIQVAYHGIISTQLSQSSFVVLAHAGQPIVFNFSGAPYWFPCNDQPADKATAELNVTVPAGQVVASNGTLVQTIPSGSQTTFMWREDYPVSTYLMSVAITNYRIIHDTYVAANGRTMDLAYYVYPEHEGAAQAKFRVTRRMIEVFASKFGEYPFLNEKYGMAEVPIGVAAEEHQTMTSLGDGVAPSPLNKDAVIAHELAHQWWGDYVTLADWPHLWLNEGFASYAEALWFESQGGVTAYRNQLASFKPLISPGTVYEFGTNAYFKGAWVLHMLRHVVGDATFAEILPTYARAFAYSNASTEDFQAVCESVSGMDLGWFFQEWIYGRDQPSYTYSWYTLPSPAGGRVVLLTIKQAQTVGLFRMPIDVRVTTSSGAKTVVVQDSLAEQRFQFPVDGNVTRLELDPDQWILRTIQQTTPPIRVALDILPGSCDNPFNTRVFGRVPAASEESARGGVLPVALLGDAHFDVSRVNLSSITLENVAPLRWEVGDIAAPPSSGSSCPVTGADGRADVSFKFPRRDLAAALKSSPRADIYFMTLAGRLDNGTPFVANDYVRILGNINDPLGGPLPDPSFSSSELPTATLEATVSPLALRSKPGAADGWLRLSLSDATPATLELFDIMGRKRWSREVGGLGAGEHDIQVTGAARLAPGIYLARVTQGGHFVTARLAVLH